MTCMLCDTNHRDPQDHPHTTTTEALCKYIREREAAAVAAAYQKAAERVRKFATEAYHEGIESHGPAREDWLRRSNDAERYAKAVETLADSAPKDATR